MCVGVPTVAVSIVDNQLANVRGFADRGCSAAITHLGWMDEELEEALSPMRPANERRAHVRAMRRVVPGDGVGLIVRGIVACVRVARWLPRHGYGRAGV